MSTPDEQQVTDDSASWWATRPIGAIVVTGLAGALIGTAVLATATDSAPPPDRPGSVVGSAP